MAQLSTRRTGVRPQRETPLTWRLNLRGPLQLGVGLTIFLVPLLRGLFYAPEQLWTEMWIGALLVLLGLTLFKERKPVRIDLVDLVGLGFVVSYLITIPRAVSPVEAREVALLWAGGYAFYWAASRGFESTRSREGLLWVAYIGALIVGLVTVLGVLGYVGVVGDYQRDRLTGPFQYANALAAYFMVLSLWGWGLFIGKSGPWRQGVILSGNTLFLLLILATQSRGVWIIYPITLGLGLWRLAPEARAKLWPAIGWNFGVALLLAAPLLATFGIGRSRTGLLLVFLTLTVGYLGGLVPGYLARWEPRRLALLRIFGLVYIAGVLVFYLAYLSSLPGGGRAALPTAITARAGTITTQDTSVQDRFYFSVMALHIAKANPWGSGGGAFNAMYHRFQRALFYSTQAHDGYAQVLDEAGIPGLLFFLGLWYLYLRRIARLPRASPEFSTAWLVGVGIIGLGLHSLMDFDLTFGALSFLVWGGLALVPSTPGQKVPVGAILPVLGGVILFIPSYGLYQGVNWGTQGAQAMVHGRLSQALTDLNRAKAWEPMEATFWFDEAQIYLTEGNATGNARLQQVAMSDLERALALNPTNLPLRVRAIQLFLLAKHFPEAVVDAQELVRLDPWDPLAYDNLARTLVVASSEALQHAAPEAAKQYLATLRGLPSQIVRQDQRYDPVEGIWFRTTPLTPDLNFKLSQAQGEYLLGKFTMAKGELTALEGSSVDQLARIWLAADLRHLGDESEATALTTGMANNSALVHESETVYRLGFYLGGQSVGRN